MTGMLSPTNPKTWQCVCAPRPAMSARNLPSWFSFRSMSDRLNIDTHLQNLRSRLDSLAAQDCDGTPTTPLLKTLHAFVVQARTMNSELPNGEAKRQMESMLSMAESVVNPADYINRFIVICSASTYYFNNKRTEALSDGTFTEDKPASVCLSWHIAYVNHIGSIAVGAFIIAVIRIIKYTLVYMTQQLEHATSGSGAG